MGDKLISVNGEDLLIEDYYIELTDEPVSVYNFQVEDFHTYFVGNCGVWVHNAECGGSYKDVKEKNKAGNKGKSKREQCDAHHIPADNAYPNDLKDKIGTVKSGNKDKVNGPAISMENGDHTQTASYGRSAEAEKYRAKQNELIRNGKFQEAFDMDVADIKSKFPGKYDSSINEAEQYLNELIKEGKIK